MKTVSVGKTRTARIIGLFAALLLAAALLAPAAPASAATGPVWQIGALSNSTAQPGTTFEYFLRIRTSTESLDGSTVNLKVDLPPGLTGVSASNFSEHLVDCPSSMVGASSFTCSGNPTFVGTTAILLRVAVDPGAQPGESLTAAFEIEGGGAESPARTVDPIRIAASSPTFGFDVFDGSVLGVLGQAFTLAAGHPDSQGTGFDVAIGKSSVPWVGERAPVEDIKRISVELPPGFVGNPTGADTCTSADLANSDSSTPEPLCPEESQVGVATIRDSGVGAVDFSYGPSSLFNMVPPPGVPARFGFNVLGTVVLLDAHVRSDGDYGLTVTSGRTPQALAIAGTTVTTWGVPADEKHKPERSCAGEVLPKLGGPTCETDAAPQPFLRNPTSCSSEGLETRIRANSWQHPETFAEDSFRSHEAPGYPLSPEPSTFPVGYSGPTEWGKEVGIDGCESVPFEPGFSARPTTSAADSPSGLEVDLTVPQEECWGPKATPEEAEEAPCQSDLKDAKVTLPEGMTLNPSSASGLGACSPQQVGLSTPVGQASPIHFDEAPVTCPDSSKIGDVEIVSPLLEDPLKGAVYLAQQEQNPFGSLLAMYMVAEGSGVVIKQAGEITADPKTGQLTSHFAETPQLPFSSLHLDLYGGPRAALRTPGCGSYSSQAVLTPWARPGEAVSRQSSFEVNQGCGGGFSPKLAGGSESPLAATTSPFSLRITREANEAEIAGLKTQLPPGLSGYLKGIPYCPDATLAAISAGLGTGAGEEAHPACPAASRLGTVVAGAGAGPDPFYVTSGRAYLAGPYKGAPLSIAAVAPAVAGPFDLGTVVVRNALRIDPETAQITVDSDPIPTILYGIPLELRDLRVQIDREHFTLNPTDCEPLQVGSTITSSQGQSASPSVHFQVAGCDKLGFKPRLSLKLKGGTQRTDHPGLTAVLRPRPGDANLSRVQVALPHSEFLAQSHIGTICTRVQFAADTCPPGSVYGTVTATSPLLDYPLTGDVYLRSSDHPLPDMVLKLKGPATQPIEIDTVGRIDSKNGGLRTTFATVPDQPLSKVILRLPAGRKSLLENSTDVCRGKHRASVAMSGQNGRQVNSTVPLRAKCPRRGEGGRHGGRGGKH